MKILRTLVIFLAINALAALPFVIASAQQPPNRPPAPKQEPLNGDNLLKDLGICNGTLNRTQERVSALLQEREQYLDELAKVKAELAKFKSEGASK